MIMSMITLLYHTTLKSDRKSQLEFPAVSSGSSFCVLYLQHAESEGGDPPHCAQHTRQSREAAHVLMLHFVLLGLVLTDKIWDM